MKDLPVRKNIRLRGHDYSQAGYYFITICVKDRHELLGKIGVGAGSTRPQCQLSEYGNIVERGIISLSCKYQGIAIDKYVVMPNHIHFILRHYGNRGQGQPAPDGRNGRVDPAPTIGNVIGYYKYQTTIKIGIRGFWQRSYHDHIIKNMAEYQKICGYIDENLAKWTEDCYFKV